MPPRTRGRTIFNLPWRSMALLAVIAIFIAAWWRPHETAGNFSQASNAELIRMVAESSDTRRRLASMQLLSRGVDGVRSIVEAIDRTPPESSGPYLQLLDDAMSSHDGEITHITEEALERYAQSDDQSLHQSAEVILHSHEPTREARALSQLQSLGMQINRLDEASDDVQVLSHVLIFDGRWHGTENDFLLLGRIFQRKVPVYFDREIVVSEEILAALRQIYPPNLIRTRDFGCLGLIGDRRRLGFEITNVIPDSPAFRVGLKRGDVIRRFGQKSLSSYEELSEQTAMRRPGDRVQISISRNHRILSYDIVLGSDFGTGHCACFDEIVPDSRGNIGEPPVDALHPENRPVQPQQTTGVGERG